MKNAAGGGAPGGGTAGSDARGDAGDPGTGEPSADSRTHGFLFADLRGYTRLVETRGAVEASRLLERYRAVTRSVVAGHGGAEIKTEGDSFYVVLPSASVAVRCGLALVAACADPADGGLTIPVGVGIHAGEAVAHEGGYVGSAVNIAARVCAVAGPGELLATATVRELTRSVVDARFASAGRRALKGIAEPIELFRVTPARTTQGAGLVAGDQPAGERVAGRTAGRAPLAAGGIVALLVVVALAAWLVGPGRGAPAASPSPLPSAAGQGPLSSPDPGPSGSASPAAPGGSEAAFPDAVEAGLLARLPPAIATTCRRGSNPAPAATASLICGGPVGVPISDLRFLWFRDAPASAGARVDRVAADMGLADGRCEDGAEAHGPWGLGTIPTGRVACYRAQSINDYWLDWSYDADGILVRAHYPRQRLAEMERWWSSNAAGLIAHLTPPAAPAPSPSPSP